MSTRIVKVKNTGTNDTWLGHSISTGQYYQIPVAELVNWAEDDKVFTDIGGGKLVVNRGIEPDDDITDVTQGYKWLVGDFNPPRSADGDWHVVHENFAHVTGNDVVNWSVEKFLDSTISYSEIFVIPNNRTFTLNFLEGGSSNVPVNVKIEYFDIINGEICRINPDIRVDEFYLLTVDGIHNVSESIISVIDNGVNVLQNIEPDLCYGFKDGTNDTFYRKIVSVDVPGNTITLDDGLSVNISSGTKIGLVDRVIGQKGTLQANVTIDWTSPPRFFGNGSRYLKLTITNDDITDGGLVTGMVNGWLTNSNTGD